MVVSRERDRKNTQKRKIERKKTKQISRKQQRTDTFSFFLFSDKSST
jgi:hypothetical protein